MSPNENHNTDYLSALPYDIIIEMVSRMDISATNDLLDQVNRKNPGDTKYDGVRDAAGSRKSVVKYLSKSFGDGIALLEAMSKHFVYISGSRSLEFFSEGHVDDDSDWDFYAPRHPYNVYGIMTALENLGVTWMTIDDELEKIVRDKGKHMLVDGYKAAHITNHSKGKWYENCFTFNDLIWAIGESKHFHVFMQDGKLSIEPGDANDGYASGDITTIIRGQLKRKGSVTPIQLIVEPRKDTELSVPSLYTFHSSCVQSYIGPYTACHMYGKLVSDGVSYGWRNNIAHDLKLDIGKLHTLSERDIERVPGWSKYAKRGFKYMYPPEGPLGFELRYPDDCRSTWLEYSAHSEAPRDVIYRYTQVAKTSTWVQTSWSTVSTRIKYSELPGNESLDLGTWHDHPEEISSDISSYLDQYIPHMRFRSSWGKYVTIQGRNGP